MNPQLERKIIAILTKKDLSVWQLFEKLDSGEKETLEALKKLEKKHVITTGKKIKLNSKNKILNKKNCLDASIKENVSPVLIVMDYLKSQVESLFARDENLFKLLEKPERNTIVLRGFLHSPSKKFIKSKKDVIYEDLINDEILKAYKLHLIHKLDYDKLMELSKSYLDTYMRLRDKKGYISLEEYKKIILNK